jgi:hypothetical protein|tara:strand:+ start:62 stop:274 length:213 start_codon:yes stop_codon:yes gene_type:complete
MSDRITSSTLQAQLDKLNNKLGESAQMELDHAACYGGYCLTWYKGSHHATPRMSGKELNQYLNGALDYVS